MGAPTPDCSTRPRRSRQQWLLAGLLCLGLVRVPGMAAQGALVEGTVQNASGYPLGNAVVELPATGLTASTTPSGHFTFRGVPAGPQELTVRLIGFEPLRVRIVVDANRGWAGTLRLSLATVLPEIEVTARADRPPQYIGVTKYDDFFRRKRMGFGTFRTREDIAKLGAQDLMGTLRGIAGVRASMTLGAAGMPTANLRLSRCEGKPPPLAIYVDGHQITIPKGPPVKPLQPRPFERCYECEFFSEVMSSISINEVELVEFYHGVAQIPSDLDRTNNCAALVVWTR